MYSYQYYAYMFEDATSLVLDEAYAPTANTITVILCVLAFALAVFTAIAIKKARPLGVIVAILQPIGLFAASKAVIAFTKIDISLLAVRGVGNSADAARDNLAQKIADIVIDDLAPQILEYNFYTIILGVAAILTIIYAGVLMRAKAKGFAVSAFILLLVRFLFISPVRVLGCLYGGVTQNAQVLWDGVFRFMYLLPLLLLACQALSILVANKKEKNAPVAATETEEPAPIAEAPADETNE